jgi:hypothetical protein
MFNEHGRWTQFDLIDLQTPPAVVLKFVDFVRIVEEEILQRVNAFVDLYDADECNICPTLIQLPLHLNLLVRLDQIPGL